MKLSVVIPCYNEEPNIKELAQAFVDEGFCTAIPEGFELVLVDNGSRDGTGREIAAACERHPFVKHVTVVVNQGYGYGITQGLAAATGDFVGWMHADLQTRPNEFLKFMQAYNAGKCAKTVFARGLRKNRPWLDSMITFGMGCYETLLFGTKMFDINAQPTVMNRAIYESWTQPPKDFSLDLYAYYWAVSNGCALYRWPVQQHARAHGESSWNTGLSARIALSKKTMRWSRDLKKSIDAQTKQAKG